MQSSRVLALILAGGAGNRLGDLTRRRAKPVVPFMGVYRLIDFALSNCLHSELRDVWVVEQFEATTLNDHLKNGRPWDLDRTYGGLQIVPPQQRQEGGEWHEGNADALWSNADAIRAFNPDLVLVLSADAVYRFDYRDAIQSHVKNEAEVTLVTSKVARDEATRFGNVRIGPDGRVEEFQYKPDEPMTNGEEADVTAEVFVYDAKVLLEILGEIAEKNGHLKDFGDELLPQFVERGRAFAHPLGGELGDYWRDVGTVESYFDAHFDFARPYPPFRLDDPRWPILTRFAPRAPSRVGSSARLDNVHLSPGCSARGEIENAVLGAGAVVELGAHVRDAIINSGAVIEAGAHVERAVVDEGVRVRGEHRGGEEILVVAGAD